MRGLSCSIVRPLTSMWTGLDTQLWQRRKRASGSPRLQLPQIMTQRTLILRYGSLLMHAIGKSDHGMATVTSRAGGRGFFHSLY